MKNNRKNDEKMKIEKKWQIITKNEEKFEIEKKEK